MGITGRTRRTEAACVVAAALLGIGAAGVAAVGQAGGGDHPTPAAALDPTCVADITTSSPGARADAPERGLIARGDALNRRYGLGRYAEGGECADLPQWFVTLILRSDALNRAERLGAYAPTDR